MSRQEDKICPRDALREFTSGEGGGAVSQLLIGGWLSMVGGVEVLTASVFSVKTETNSSCGSEDKSGGVGIWGGLGVLQPYGLPEGAVLMNIEGGQSC